MTMGEEEHKLGFTPHLLVKSFFNQVKIPKKQYLEVEAMVLKLL